MGRRVFIVDDDERFRELLRAVLDASPDFEVVGEAREGGAALAEVAELEPDLVLLDVNLPDANGFELASRFAVPGHGPEVVMISSRDDWAYVEMAGDAGATGFVSKHDLSPAALLDLLDGVG